MTPSRVPKRPRVPSIPSRRRTDVTRAEFNRLLDQIKERGTVLDELRHNQEIQFKRIAQLQAEIDELRTALARARQS